MLQPRNIPVRLSCTSLITLTLVTNLLLAYVECGIVSNIKSSKVSPSSQQVLPKIEVYEVKRENMANINNAISTSDHISTSSLQMLNVTRNGDLLFGENTAQNSGLLLQCNAPYSVQWIFRGDSDPEFNTNTTTTTDQNTGTNSFSAYLFMGSRRNLNEQETGQYICTSVRNKKLYSYVYIYVTRAALFTNKGLETIYYSQNDPSIRIPCSLSEPRATTALQKSENGILKCPMSESVRFDPKHGYILSPKGREEPQGTYLCIADYNNTFQIIKYTIVQDNHQGSGSPSDPNSEEFGPHEPSEFEPPHQQQSTPRPISTPSCKNVTCGENAHCIINLRNDAVCRCKEGYSGNPFVKCKHNSQTTTTSTPRYPPIDSDDYCDTYDDCPDDKACVKHKCQNPCTVNSICGPNTHCEPQNHTPFCQCKKGYDGDPYSSQEGQRCDKTYCNPNPCGPNTNCMHVNGNVISCSCKPGYSTRPGDDTCRPDQKVGLPSKIETKSTSTTTETPKISTTQIPVSASTERNRYPHPPTAGLRPPSFPRPIFQNRTNGHGGGPLPPGKECHYDTDCPDDKMCIQDKCENPCVNACGSGARCHIRNHFPRCACPEGTTGDPFYNCTPFGSPTTAVPPESIVGGSINNNHFGNHVNCGGRYSPCGPNSICQANRQRFVCACPNDFIGDPYSARGCYRARGYQQCERDEDCPHFLACLRLKGCVNPCNVHNVCKHGRSCVPFLHRPTCVYTAHIVDLPRDDLSTQGAQDNKVKDEADNEEEIGFLDFQEGLDNSSCFLRSDNKIISPCGQNSVCYDSVLTNKAGAFCGCMENFIGDPYVGCEAAQACKYNSTCGPNGKCENGFCKQNATASDSTPTNPCYPSPCSKHGDECVINVENYSAECVSPSHSLVEGESSLSVERFRSEACLFSGTCDEKDDDEEQDQSADDVTTEFPLSSTILPSTTVVSSSLPEDLSSVASAKVTHQRISKTRKVDTPNYSKETTPTSNESTMVLDA